MTQLWFSSRSTNIVRAEELRKHPERRINRIICHTRNSHHSAGYAAKCAIAEIVLIEVTSVMSVRRTSMLEEFEGLFEKK